MPDAPTNRRGFLAVAAAAVAALFVSSDYSQRSAESAGGDGAVQIENGTPLLLAAGEGAPYWTMGMLMTIKAAAGQTQSGFGVMEALMPAGSAPPFHIHHHEAEINYVLDGLITFQCGDQVGEYGPGSFIYLPQGVPHRFKAGPEGARMLGIVAPGGLEHLYVEPGEPAQALRLPEAPPDVAKWLSLAARYGIEVVGPPLA